MMILRHLWAQPVTCSPFPAIPTPQARKAFARRCLDSGAIGILFPNVQSGPEAVDLVKNCYYPAAAGVSGTRGFGYGGCNADGAEFAAYAAAANSRIVVGVQLENTRAFAEDTLREILAVDGLRFTQDGPYDHSGSHLVPGATADARVVAELARYRAMAQTAGIPAGKHVVQPTPQNIAEAVEAGYSFIALGTDMQHVQQGCARAMAVVAAAAEAAP